MNSNERRQQVADAAKAELSQALSPVGGQKTALSACEAYASGATVEDIVATLRQSKDPRARQVIRAFRAAITRQEKMIDASIITR